MADRPELRLRSFCYGGWLVAQRARIELLNAETQRRGDAEGRVRIQAGGHLAGSGGWERGVARRRADARGPTPHGGGCHAQRAGIFLVTAARVGPRGIPSGSPKEKFVRLVASRVVAPHGAIRHLRIIRVDRRSNHPTHLTLAGGRNTQRYSLRLRTSAPSR
jgi:hypothetical protein